MNDSKITVLGNGGFGTSLAIVADLAGHAVWQWGHDREYTEEIARSRRNPRYLPADLEVPETITLTPDAEEALADARAVVMGVPTQFIRGAIGDLKAHIPAGVPLISLAKGLEQQSGKRPSEVLQEVLEDRNPVLVLSGPSHAEEVARGLPTAVVLAGRDQGQVQQMQEALSTDNFRIYTNSDRLGVEICGALKNVMAVAAGIAQGYGLGDNAKAAILSRGIVEMARFGCAQGAQLHTFFGLAGMGDLAATAFSQHGRNRAFGEHIGKGEKLADVLASTHKVAEGVWTSRVVRDKAEELGVEMPLSVAVARVLFEDLPVGEALRSLMGREQKDEVLL